MSSFLSQANKLVTERQLGFGIHSNVKIRSIDGERRKKQDGTFVNALLHIKFSQLDNAGNLYAEREIPIWNLNLERADTKEELLRRVLAFGNQLEALILMHYGREKTDQLFEPFAAIGVTDLNQMETAFKVKTTIDQFQEIAKQQFVEAMKPFTGLESPYSYRLKLTYNYKGTHIVLPNYDYIEFVTVPAEQSTLQMTADDLKAKMEAEKPKSSDPMGLPGKPRAMQNPFPGAMPGAGAPVAGGPQLGFGGQPAAPVASIPGMPAAGVIPGTAPAGFPTPGGQIPANPVTVPGSPSAANPMGTIPGFPPVASA